MAGQLSQTMQASTTAQARAPGIRLWNIRQLKTFLRYGSLYHVPLTADVIAPLAVRYAEKHATTRPRMLQQRQSS
jgi:hypothetical protein